MSKESNYKYECGEILKTTKSEWLVLGREKYDSHVDGIRKRYLCKCKKCDSSQWKTESELYSGVSGREGMGNCGVCFNRVVVTGKNDIATTHPHIVRYFKNPEDALHINAGSREKRIFVCPICEEEIETCVEYVAKRGRVSCKKCSDHVSYPNKLAYSILKQLNAEQLEAEYNDPSWNTLYRYDFSFYKNNIHYLLEMDGGFHYEAHFQRSIEFITNRDKEKDEIAQKNNCKLIRIDCRKSSIPYIREKLFESELSKIFDLNLIDWAKVEKDCGKNILFEIANYYSENPNANLAEIADRYNLCLMTVRTYLKRANNMGIIQYRTLIEEMDYNLVKVLDYKRAHMDYTNTKIGEDLGINCATVRNYLIRAKKQGLIDCIDASEYIKIKTKEYIKDHLDLTDYRISLLLGKSKEYIRKCRMELSTC